MIKQSNRMFDLPLQNANAFQTITKSTPDLLKHLIECPKDGLIDRGRTSSSNRLTHMELLRHELELNIIWQNHDVWVDQICQFLWIRSPALEFTLRTARDRYYQFFELLASNLTVSPEPTPDIQLVWLTHQLSLSSFDRFSRSFDGRLVEHDAVPPVLGNQEALASTETAFRARFGEGYAGIVRTFNGWPRRASLTFETRSNWSKIRCRRLLTIEPSNMQDAVGSRCHSHREKASIRRHYMRIPYPWSTNMLLEDIISLMSTTTT